MARQCISSRPAKDERTGDHECPLGAGAEEGLHGWKRRSVAWRVAGGGVEDVKDKREESEEDKRKGRARRRAKARKTESP